MYFLRDGQKNTVFVHFSTLKNWSRNLKPKLFSFDLWSRVKVLCISLKNTRKKLVPHCQVQHQKRADVLNWLFRKTFHNFCMPKNGIVTQIPKNFFFYLQNRLGGVHNPTEKEITNLVPHDQIWPWNRLRKWFSQLRGRFSQKPMVGILFFCGNLYTSCYAISCMRKQNWQTFF